MMVTLQVSKQTAMFLLAAMSEISAQASAAVAANDYESAAMLNTVVDELGPQLLRVAKSSEAAAK